MAEVILNEGESLESALRRFKRKVQQEDIIKDVKEAFLLPEAWRKETDQTGPGAQASAQKNAQCAILGRKTGSQA